MLHEGCRVGRGRHISGRSASRVTIVGGMSARLPWVRLGMRLGKGGLGALLAVACVSDPPTYGAGITILPYFAASSAQPPLGEVYLGGYPLEINVPFRSEDNGVPLVALLYLDLSPGAPADEVMLESDLTLPPSNYEDEEREVVITFEPSGEELDGCHSLTLVLTPESNFNRPTQLPIDETVVARLVWWLGDRDASLASCPSGR